MLIRAETATDRDAVRAIHEAAFDTKAEADLVEVLREETHPLVSMVAEEHGTPVGHILFSPVSLSGHAEFAAMGLAPMAVVPAKQRRGIGTALVRAGLSACRKIGCRAVVVLGHPEYYPRFGFVPAVRFGIDSEYDVPDEAFMVVELDEHALQGRSGTVKYAAAFSLL